MSRLQAASLIGALLWASSAPAATLVASAAARGSTVPRVDHPSGLYGARSLATGGRDAALDDRVASPDRLGQQAGGVLAEPAPATYANRSAILTSLLLPGLAQYRMGKKERGVAFFVAEVAFWTGFAAFRVQGENREESYIEMAELFAGISPNAPTDDDFYKTLAGWPSSDLYNEIIVRRNARAVAGDDLEAREAYYEANKIQGDETWEWDSEAARDRFREKRSEAQSSFKKSRNMVGLAVANRVVAMIDAVLLSRRLERSSYGLEFVPELDRGDLVARVALRRSVP